MGSLRGGPLHPSGDAGGGCAPDAPQDAIDPPGCMGTLMVPLSPFPHGPSETGHDGDSEGVMGFRVGWSPCPACHRSSTRDVPVG